jgi:hypothetical protein
MPPPLATVYYLPANAPSAEIKAAAQMAMKNYETLNNTPDHGELHPAGVWVGNDWRPAGEAAS